MNATITKFICNGIQGNESSTSSGTQEGEMKYWNGSEWVAVQPGNTGQTLTFCNGKPTWTSGGNCPGGIQSINCSSPSHNGTLTAGTIANAVSSVLTYSGANGGSYLAQSIASTGVTGLTANLSAGSFGSGSGNLTFTISGTPSTYGTASFEINLAGKTCTLARTVEGITLPTSGTGPSITDADGNTYGTVYIGSQQWMSENLKTTKYNDGTSLTSVQSQYFSEAVNNQGSYTLYNDVAANNTTYGKLYDIRAVRSDKLCPTGWHIPSDAEWAILTDYVGGEGVAGGKLKSQSNLWNAPNQGAANSVQFNGLPGGNIGGGNVIGLGINSFWWSSTKEDYGSQLANKYISMNYGTAGINKGNASSYQGYESGLYVRCLKDQNQYQAPIQGAVQTINCETVNLMGNFTKDMEVLVPSFNLTYSGGNGGSHNGLNVASTGVSGLTLTAQPGTIANGEGVLVCKIQGTPTSLGIASFTITLGGKTCALTKEVVMHQGYVTQLDCGAATVVGNVVMNTEAVGVTVNIPYKGGNGGGYETTETGAGDYLKALLEKGVLANGDGTLILKVSGIPKQAGSYTFSFSSLTNLLGPNGMNAGVNTCSFSIPVSFPEAQVTTLNCESATHNGTLNAGETVVVQNNNGMPGPGGPSSQTISSTITYTGGNGGTYQTKTFNSTGVTGLVATLEQGSLPSNPNDPNAQSGAGSLTFNITGTPSAGGTASFEINFGGKTCTLTRTVNASQNQPSEINFTSSETPVGTFQENISDIDGNSYKTVKIGNQTWMGENLKTSKYNDGTTIPNITDNTQWDNNTTGAWAYYNNDPVNNAKYGKLYNWYAVSPTTNGNKNVCPIGWKVPSDDEWTSLIDYLGGTKVAGNKMKEIGTTNWNPPVSVPYQNWTPSNATNTSLFTGLPGGYRAIPTCNSFKELGYWWSVTQKPVIGSNMSNEGFSTLLSFVHGEVVKSFNGKREGLSVRCIKDESSNTQQPVQGSIQSIDCGTATNNGTLTAATLANGVTSVISYAGGNGGTHNGQVVTSTGVSGLTATLQAGTFANGNGTLSYEITGTPNAQGTASFEINIGGKMCSLTRTVNASQNQPSEINFTSSEIPVGTFQENISDIDGNSYKTVKIGNQTWMGENLKTSKYNDGTTIPNITDNTQWDNNTTGAWAYYNNDPVNNAKYGKLYNWYAVSPTTNGNKNVCPTGWHVPTDAEWTVLTDYLGGETVAGGKMKEVGTTSWFSPNTGATNTSLFSALPVGQRFGNGSYNYVGVGGYWWSSTENWTSSAWDRIVYYNYGNAYRGHWVKNDGLSVRCLRD